MTMPNDTGWTGDLHKPEGTYLGDCIYVDYDAEEDEYILMHDDGYALRDTIRLKPSVYLALRKFVARTSGVPDA